MTTDNNLTGTATIWPCPNLPPCYEPKDPCETCPYKDSCKQKKPVNPPYWPNPPYWQEEYPYIWWTTRSVDDNILLTTTFTVNT